MSDLFVVHEAIASCALDGETQVVEGPYDHLVEPTAIVLHSFDGGAMERGEAWGECSTERKDVFRYMADCVLHAVAPSIEREYERSRGGCRV